MALQPFFLIILFAATGPDKSAVTTIRVINWEVLLPLLITTLVAIVGWYVVHRQSSIRDRENKKRDVRVEYLIDAYRHLEAAGSRSPKAMEKFGDGFESAISDIQLFGSVEQARLARELVQAIAARRSDASTGKLLLSLRDDLRRELHLEPVADEPVHFRIKKG